MGEWIAKWNDFPQKKKTAKHLLVIPRRHIVNLSEMTLDDWVHSGHLIQWVISEFKIPGGGILTRFGTPFLNAGTVEHLHINIMEPNGQVEFRPPLCKEPEENAEGLARLEIFKKLWLGYSVGDLYSEEIKLIEGRHPEVPAKK